MSSNVILWVLKESPIEGCKHQNDSDVHHQSFPEMVPEDEGIYGHDDGYHRHHVRHRNHQSCHCDLYRVSRFEVPVSQDREGPLGGGWAHLALFVDYTVRIGMILLRLVDRPRELDPHLPSQRTGKPASKKPTGRLRPRQIPAFRGHSATPL